MPAVPASIEEATSTPASPDSRPRQPTAATAAAPLVYVVDDDPLVCAMLSALVASLNITCTSFNSAADFLGAFDAARPGCLLCDVNMPGMTGLDLQRELNIRGTSLPVIFVTAYADVATAVTAMRDGAFDYLLKPFNHADLFEKLHAALAFDQAERSLVSGAAIVRDRLRSLTAREREVLGLLMRGLPNKEMAAQMCLSLRTVELHRARLMSKMGAKSVAELVRTVTELGRTGSR
jgi:two-component system, LuxR family, response regulator FixJ